MKDLVFKRDCIVCKEPFDATWIDHRLCKKCYQEMKNREMETNIRTRRVLSQMIKEQAQ